MKGWTTSYDIGAAYSTANKAKAIAKAKYYANSDGEPVTISVQYTREPNSKSRVLGFSASDIKFGKDIIVKPDKTKNPSSRSGGITLKLSGSPAKRAAIKSQLRRAGYEVTSRTSNPGADLSLMYVPSFIDSVTRGTRKAVARVTRRKRNPHSDYQDSGTASTLTEANNAIAKVRRATPASERSSYRSVIKFDSSTKTYIWYWIFKT